MKRILAMIMIALICFSTFPILSPRVKAESEVITLPAGAWQIAGHTEDSETILHAVDVDSTTPGDQQIIYASPGQTITISYTFQMWSSGGPGIIKQALFAYSWASSWPPWDAYTPLYDGGSGGYYPGFYRTDSFSITVPSTPGEYKVWFCSEAHYSMNQAMQGLTAQPTMLPHALVVVESGEEASSTADPTNDLYYYGSGSPAPTWSVIDIVYAEISQADSAHIRLLTRASQPIPLTNQWQSFYWLLDTGTPAPAWSNPIDVNDLTVSYYIGVSWGADGPLWVSVNKYDNTGTYELVKEDARSHPETYFSGDTCSITIPLSLIGNPASVKFVAGSADGQVPGSIGRHDKAPNIGHCKLASAPSIESVTFNRIPAVTTQVGFQLSHPPIEYTASMPGLGVWADVTILNPTPDDFNGRLRVFFRDPDGNEVEHFALSSDAIYVTVPAQSSITITVPIYGTGLFGADAGMYTIRFVLGKGTWWYDWVTMDEKTTQLLVTPNNPIDGPKHHGITIPISELLTAKKPSIKDAALEFLNLALLLAQALGSAYVSPSGVYPGDPQSIKDILPGMSAITDLSGISHALDTSTFFKAKSKKNAANIYSLSFQAFLNPTTIKTADGEYTFDPSYDRIRVIAKLPAGVVVTDKGDALEVLTDDSGSTTITWIDNYCDKLFNGLSSKTHTITVQVRGGATYSVQAYAYFEIGPLGQKPESSVFPAIDYNKWNSDPANVYWIEMTTKEDTLKLKGSS